MKFRVSLIVIMCIFLASSSRAESRFVDYPTLARSTGEGVRLRSKPSTDSKVLGKLAKFDFVIVIGARKIDGETWYEVDHPTQKGHAYVFEKYLEPCYQESNQHDKLQKLQSTLDITYGMNIEKATALFGKPAKRTSRKSEYSDYQRITLDWGSHNVSYIDGDLLVAIEVKRGNNSFGNIHIGDSTEKLLSEFGAPAEDNGNSWAYMIKLNYDEETEISYVIFYIKNGKVTRMYFEVPNDGNNGG